jgi:hypothetical protein
MRGARANAAAAAIDAVRLAFHSCREEFEHSLTAARKTLAPPKPARDPNADGPKREKHKLSLAGRNHEGQGELTEDAAPADA